jgi:hypothetical protein
MWRLEEATYCPTCDCYKCPKCGRCFCDLPEGIRFALDAEMASIDLWEPWHNLPRRKKRGKDPFEMSKDEFLGYAERCHPELFSGYRAGEYDLEGLRARVMAKIGRVIVLR